jgi:hypothetical protein
MLQLWFAIALRSGLCFQSARPSPQALRKIRGNRIGKANLFQKNDFSHRNYWRRLGVLAL